MDLKERIIKIIENEDNEKVLRDIYYFVNKVLMNYRTGKWSTDD